MPLPNAVCRAHQRGAQGGTPRIAVVTARKWPRSGVRLSVSFMDTPRQELRTRILLHMNAWGEEANVVFSETEGTGKVRIARLDSPPDMAGYWSYIGTEILEIDTERTDAQPRRLHDADVRSASSAASSVTKPVTRSASSTNTCAATS